jgi:hypothetical protein
LPWSLAFWALIAFGATRTDLVAKLSNPAYLLQVGLFIAVGIAAAALALRTAIPGLEATPTQLSPVFLAAEVSVLVAAASGPAVTHISLGHFVGLGMKCLVCTGLLAALPWFALFWAVKRGSPSSCTWRVRWVGAAAFSFCVRDDPLRLPDR